MQNKFSFLNSLTLRIFLFFWLTFIILLICLLSLPYFDSRTYSELTEKEVITYQRELTTSIRTHQITRLLAGTPPLPADKLAQIHPVIITPTELVLGAQDTQEEHSVNQFMYDAFNSENKLLKKTFFDTQIIGPFKINLNNEVYTLLFLQKVNPQRETINFIFNHPILLILMLLVISSPLLYWLARTLGEPIHNLQRAANAVALGNFKIDPTLEKTGVAELRQVGHSFNKMTEALDDLLSSQKVLLSSISHELRTPLTRLKLSLALLRHRVGDGQEIQRIDLESQRLEKMIEDLLMISRQQLDTYLIRSTFPLSELWKDVIEDAKFEAEQMGIGFRFEQTIAFPDMYYLNGNHNQLASAVENILRNALKYTKSEILVRISLNLDQLMISIEDNGGGLDASEYEKIFRPFYRVDEARTRETGGTGLGLSIVASVAQNHGGKVWADKAELGGLRVTFCLPIWLHKSS